jgi:nucleoid-associated protein YgaU
MANLEQLKQKYASVLALIKRRNVRLDHLHVEGEKLIMKGAASNEEVKNEIWNAIKAVDAAFSDLACDLSVDSSLPPPAAEARTYVVQAGDSLSKIAKEMYGDANQYMRIFGANKDKLDEPNKIQVGQELKIPS